MPKMLREGAAASREEVVWRISDAGREAIAGGARLGSRQQALVTLLGANGATQAAIYGRGSHSRGARARRARLDRILCAARAAAARRRRAAGAGADGRPGPGGRSDRRLARAIRRLPPARRHRQRQDGGVPEPHRAGAGGGPRRAGAGPGDRADAAARCALPRAPLRPGRRPAFLACGRRAARGLARGERGQRAGRDRHALSRVHADAETRAGGRRRGARRLLQAAGGFPLFGPRPGVDARAACRRAGGARLRDALARIARERGGRPLRQAVAAGTHRPRRQAARHGRRPARQRRARRALAARHGRHRAPSRRPRAGARLPEPARLRADDVLQWLRLGRALPVLRRTTHRAPLPRQSSCAITAAPRTHCPSPARSAATSSPRSAKGPNAWRPH